MQFIVAFLLATTLSGEINYESARLERRLQAVKITEKITVDGRLNETAWSSAPQANNFTQNEPLEDQPASEKTQVSVLYDNNTLYFGIYAHDSDPGRLIISELKKDFNPGAGDSVGIILDTFRDERNGYHFVINPAGAKWDAQMANEGRETNENWDAVWSVKTLMVEDGWTAEIAIPFKTLKFRNSDVQTWGINFHRMVRRKNEDSFWSPMPRIYSLSRVSLAGTLEGLEGVRPGANVRIKPYVISSFGQFADGRRDTDADFGVDAKYGLTPGLTWDFTYNTDFSQVEADDEQINLTRFSLFFPEKREFFLENSGIFQFSGGSDRGPAASRPSRDMLFFFSRRIGLSEDRAPVPILGGTRLTGRAGPFELGFLNIQQREQEGSPATNFTVARVRRNFLGNSDIGVMLVNKEVQDSPYFNRVAGVDANFRFGQTLNLYSFLAKSWTPSGGGRDLAGRVSLHYLDNMWSFRSSYTSIQEDYTNEMGFVPRKGIRKFAGLFGREFRPVKTRRTIRRFYPHLPVEYILDADGNLETRGVNYHFILELQNGSTFEIGLNTFLERLSEPFTINTRKNVVIPAGVYTYHEYMLTGQTDSSRLISGNLRLFSGPFFTGYKHSYNVSGTLRLNHRFNTSIGTIHNNINLPEGHFKTNLVNFRFNYSFSTAMFLNGLIQYNTDSQQWSSNIRFNLIHRPLSDLYIVYNERRDTISSQLIDRAIIAKFTYMIAR
ncbi:MAG: DUF5916 domain-containing protein [Acidobacteria bacterium]|nr:DUF5916 domain-containing protein [Acidobacteriota bacterium]